MKKLLTLLFIYHSSFIITKAQSTDSLAILMVVKNFESAFNQKDPKAFATLFAEDADFVNWFGQPARGRQKIEEFHIPVLKQVHRTSVQKVNQTNIRFLKPDLAAVDVHWKITAMTTPDGKPLPDRKGIMVLTMSKEKGDWWIKVFHNINIDPPMQGSPKDRETEIRRLEMVEHDAVMKGDSTVLFGKIWSNEMVLNSPGNMVGTVEVSKSQLRTGNLAYLSFERNIEKITFNDNIAIVMGGEILKPQGIQRNAGKTVTRRFTNIWKFSNNQWAIIGRQATIIKVE